MAAGVVPQSSCSLRPQAPAATISISASGRDALPFPNRPEIDRQALGRLEHAGEVPGPGGAGGGAGALGRAGAAAQHGGDAGVEGLLDQLRADPVDVAVDPAGGEDAALAGDDLGAGADDDVDVGLDVGVAGLADGGDAAVAQAHIGLDDAPVVEDEGVGDDGVDAHHRRA